MVKPEILEKAKFISNYYMKSKIENIINYDLGYMRDYLDRDFVVNVGSELHTIHSNSVVSYLCKIEPPVELQKKVLEKIKYNEEHKKDSKDSIVCIHINYRDYAPLILDERIFMNSLYKRASIIMDYKDKSNIETAFKEDCYILVHMNIPYIFNEKNQFIEVGRRAINEIHNSFVNKIGKSAVSENEESIDEFFNESETFTVSTLNVIDVEDTVSILSLGDYGNSIGGLSQTDKGTLVVSNLYYAEFTKEFDENFKYHIYKAICDNPIEKSELTFKIFYAKLKEDISKYFAKSRDFDNGIIKKHISLFDKDLFCYDPNKNKLAVKDFGDLYLINKSPSLDKNDSILGISIIGKYTPGLEPKYFVLVFTDLGKPLNEFIRPELNKYVLEF